MIKLIAIFAISLAVVSSCNSARQSQKSKTTSTPKVQTGTVAKVVDGDTIRIKINGQEKVVRMLGIDTPETHKPGVKVECGGREASANLERLAPAGARARLTYDPTQDRSDRYGRLLAYVGVNHRSLQREQLYAGLAKVYVYDKAFQRVDSYRTAEAVAKRSHRGVWGSCGGDFHDQQPGN